MFRTKRHFRSRDIKFIETGKGFFRTMKYFNLNSNLLNDIKLMFLGYYLQSYQDYRMTFTIININTKTNEIFMFDIFVWPSGSIEYSNQRIQLIKPNDVWLRVMKIQRENPATFIHLILSFSLSLSIAFFPWRFTHLLYLTSNICSFSCIVAHHLGHSCNLITLKMWSKLKLLNFYYTYE